MKKIAIVILNWNGSGLLRRFLPSVLAHSPEDLAEVVVADNGSSDDSV
ncbi:MAG: glycosyltransferase family 2 protein, partial [Tannerellaceae bacterium]|nr:glycosyltransferase family 2 protein [Tannerellaceae bacterium]